MKNWIIRKVKEKPFFRKSLKRCPVCGCRMDIVDGGNNDRWYDCDFCDNIEKIKR